jgi:hypothetical protein
VRSGDAFPLTLLGSDCVDRRALRGGVTVPGRVVHAQAGGMFGKAAELLLAAGPITTEDGASIALRNLQTRRGTDRDGAALGASMAIGPFAAFIHGGNVVMPVGTPLLADIRQAISLPLHATTPCGGAIEVSSTTPQGQPHDAPETPHPDLGHHAGFEPAGDGAVAGADRGAGPGDNPDDGSNGRDDDGND